ncbi:MAG: hypothetical protein Q8M57_08640 [Nitrosomonas sp.]|uniref:NACHT domain-containing protein n=1 Tax=Nitrosomonas sp. TaxID=42353 RepID=UPI00273291A6|nr:hypothetical protein [Nitrosomonas sp.]MDP3281095.1 hypothetical protein [Nitrosomonas sp.]
MSDNKCTFPWPRYWFPEGNGDNSFVQSGYLILPSPEYSHYYPAIPKRLSEMTQIPVLILLGEPGYGKSHALKDESKRIEKEQAGDLVIFEDLKTFVSGSEQRLLDIDKFKLVEQGRRLWILLDSLDECTLPVPGDWLIYNFINKINNPEKVFVRITCRPSHWPEKLAEAFLERWRSVTKSPVELWRLCPLRQDDIRMAANTSQIDGEDFLNTVAERNAEQLAALPVTLQFMLKLFQEKRLPELRTKIFEQGLELLCNDSPDREASGIKSQIPTGDRFQVAAKIALGYILQGCNSIWLGSRVQCPSGLFDANEVTSKEAGQDINDNAVKETLELTGIFARLDGKRFQFASRTFAEFLAAWYIAKSTVPTQQKLKVLLHPDSQRLITDLRETAAWLAALDTGFRAWLVNHEPEAALEADFATLAQVDLPVLVDGLLRLAVEEQGYFYEAQRLAKLKYPGLESKLSGVITDNSAAFAARALAIRIARACELQSLGTELADLALNDQEDSDLRKLAITCMDNSDDNAKTRLISLAESDQDLSLKAMALSVLGPGLMGAQDFFREISPGYIETASYELRNLIDEDLFLDKLDTKDLIIGLRWIAKHAPIGHDQFTSNRLKSRLIAKAFDYLDTESVVVALVEVMIALCSHHEFLFDGLDRNEPQNFFDDIINRRIVLTELIRQVDTSDIWKFISGNCFREEDCLWLFAQLDSLSLVSERRVIATIIEHLIWRHKNRDAVEEALNRAGVEVNNPDPILKEHLASIIIPMDLSNEKTIHTKNQYWELQSFTLTRKKKQLLQSDILPDPPEFYIQTDLAACEAGDFNRCLYLIESLAMQENGTLVFPRDPNSLPGWKNADDTLRNRIASVAVNYLESAVPPNDEELLQNFRTFAQAACGLAVAIVVDTDNLQRLSNEHLSRWCLVVVTHFFDQRETQQQIFCKIRPIVPEAFDISVLKRADRDAKEGNIHFLESCEEIWHLSFLQHLAVNRLNSLDWSFCCRLKLAELLIRKKVDGVLEQLIDWLIAELDSSNRCAIGKTLFLNALNQTWPIFQKVLTAEIELAREVILAVAYNARRGTGIYAKLDVEQLGWLYDKIRSLFPPMEDPLIPNHAYSPTRRHEVADFRNNIIDRLVSLATPSAIKELDRICEAYPDSPWLIRARADACKNLWQEERTRLEFADSIRLLSDANASVVRNSQELMNVIKEALQRFAHEAQHGSPPLVTFLWNEGQKKPFSEQRLSDFLKFYLEREWRGGRIIINREVEIKNLHDFGIGERTDLLVQAVSSDGNVHQPHPCVVIEVKPDNKAKPQKDIPDQLVGKYLDGESRTCGIYLIGWFGNSRSAIEKLREKADQCALENTSEKIKINSIIVDLCHPHSRAI